MSKPSTRSIIIRWIIFSINVLLLIAAVLFYRSILSYIAISFIIAYLIAPVINYLEKYHQQKTYCTMKRAYIFLAIAVMASCTSTTTKDYIRLNGFTQGTTYSITYADSLNRDFAAPIEDILERVDSSMSLYRKNSIINNFNQSQTGIEVDSLLAHVVELSLLLSLIHI